MCLELVALLLQTIRYRRIGTRRKSIFLDLGDTPAYLEDLVVELATFLGRKGKDIGEINPLAKVTFASYSELEKTKKMHIARENKTILMT